MILIIASFLSSSCLLLWCDSLITETQTSNLGIKVTSTSFTSAQISLRGQKIDLRSDASLNNDAHWSGYEVYYKVLGSSESEWLLKPCLPSNNDINQTVILDDLLCGSSYLLYVVELQSGSRSETVTFRTQGTGESCPCIALYCLALPSITLHCHHDEWLQGTCLLTLVPLLVFVTPAPVAPRKDQVIKVVNESCILIYPFSWDHPVGCPITKLTIEYRASSQHLWTLVSSQAPSDEVIELSGLQPKSLYSVRMTAHTKGSPSTMAEYEARVGLPEDNLFFSASSHSRGVFSIDSSTLISLTSSLFVLAVGFVAVASLVLYKRKLNKSLLDKKHSHHHHHLRKPSATSAASSTIHTEVSSAALLLSTDPNHLQHHQQQFQTHRTPTSNPVSRLNREKQSQALPPVPSEEKVNMSLNKSTASLLPSSSHVLIRGKGQQTESNTSSSNGSKKSAFSPLLLRGRLPQVPIPRQQLEDMDKDLYDEITPYATFTLTDERVKVGQEEEDDEDTEFKTFTVSIGEPAYNFKVSQYFNVYLILSCFPLIRRSHSCEWREAGRKKRYSNSLRVYVHRYDGKTYRLRPLLDRFASTTEASHAWAGFLFFILWHQRHNRKKSL